MPHTWGTTGVDIFVHNYAKRVEQMWGVRWLCMHVLMHVHILTKEWDQGRGDWNMQAGPHRSTHLHTPMQREWRGSGESDGHAYMY